MNHRNKIIERLSYYQYEPISFLDFKNSQLSNESICYKKEIIVKSTKIEYFLTFSNSALLDFPKIYITESQLLLLQSVFPHITQPIPHLQERKITYLNNKLYYICYIMENNQVIPRNDLSKFLAIIERTLKDYFIKLLDKNKYTQEYVKDFLGIVVVLSDLTNKDNQSWHIVKNEDGYSFLNLKNKNDIFHLQADDQNNPDFSELFENSEVTVQSFLDFIKKWDGDSFQKLEGYLSCVNKKHKKTY